MNMDIGVFGPHGRLGSALVKLGAEPLEANISNYKELVEVIAGRHLDIVYNCAAFTQVDEAEKPENIEAVIWSNYKSLLLIQAALSPKTHLVHISTDYVFGGNRGPYTEKMRYSSKDVPVNYYGLSKQAAEMALQDWPGVTIARTTGLFGSGKPDFVTSVIDHLNQGNTMLVSDNLWGNQTYIPYLAHQLMQISAMENKPPLIHLASTDIVTRYKFAQMIASMLGKPDGLLRPAHSEFIWKVPRPVHGGLKVSLSEKFGFLQYSIQDGLAACLANVVS